MRWAWRDVSPEDYSVCVPFAVCEPTPKRGVQVAIVLARVSLRRCASAEEGVGSGRLAGGNQFDAVVPAARGLPRGGDFRSDKDRGNNRGRETQRNPSRCG